MARRRRMRGIVGLVLVLAAIAGGLWWWFRWRDAGKSADTYRTEPVSRGDVTMTVTATGTVSAVTTVLVGSQVSGIIAGLHADFNSPVTKGQLLAELDPTPFQATVAQRQADLEQTQVQLRNAELQFHRQERLLAEDLSPQADYDDAQAALDAARTRVNQTQAALDQARTNLAYTRILSPIEGVVVERQYDVGQTVAASFQAPTLFTIAQDLKKMKVQADVDQSDIGRVQVGQVARFTVDAYPGEEFRGRITQIRLNATVNQNVVSYPVIIEVPNPEEKLRPKMTADVTFDVATVKDVLRLASAALRFRLAPSANGESATRPWFGFGSRGGGSPERGPAGGTGTGGTGGGSGSPGGAADAAGRSGGVRAAESAREPRGSTGARHGGPSRAPGTSSPADRTAANGTPAAAESTRGPAGDGNAAAPAHEGAASASHGSGPTAGWTAAKNAIGEAVGGTPAGRRTQTVYRLGTDGKPEAMEIRTGISDGRFAQIVEGALQPGDKIIVGMVTAKADSSQQPFGGRRPF